MNIRKAILKDIPEILNLLNSDANLIGNDEIKYNKNHIKEYLSNSIHILFVYEIKGRIAGVVLIEFLKTAGYIYLDDIIVDARYRDRGIGRRLLNYIEEFAKKQDCELIFMFVEENNNSMRNFIIKNKYEKGKKFIFFSKKLR